MGRYGGPAKRDGQALRAWVYEARRDEEYTRLALAALQGDEEAAAELRYRFPWKDLGPQERWDEIPSPEVRHLVRMALTRPEEGQLGPLRHVLHVRVAVQAATAWNQSQATVLAELAEVA